MREISFELVGAIIIVMTIAGCGKPEQTPLQAMANVQPRLDRENAAAIAARPDLSPAQAIAQSAGPRSTQMLAKERDAGEKRFVAAGQLLGYYYATVVSRDVICRSVGVDIAPLVRTYQARFANEYQMSIAAVKTKIPNPESFLAVGEEKGRTLVRQGMVETAQKNNLTLGALCTGYSNHVDFFVAEFDLKKQMPDAYLVIHGR